jgi:hypothetical protein
MQAENIGYLFWGGIGGNSVSSRYHFRGFSAL